MNKFNSMKYTLITPKSHPDYRELIASLSELVWPEFMLQDPISIQHWDELFERFSDYQFSLWDTENQKVVGKANSVPLAWDGEVADLPDGGWDWAFLQSIYDHQADLEPQTQCALQIAIDPAYQGQGISKLMIEAMKSVGRSQRLERLIAPVRPSLKSKYPLTPMERYITWTTEHGEPFDPWFRVHARQGSQIVKVCSHSMVIKGTVMEWEGWTGMRFPDSGRYIIEGALNPIEINIESDLAIYIEPNVWMVYNQL